jgi:hypothetical protein
MMAVHEGWDTLEPGALLIVQKKRITKGDLSGHRITVGDICRMYHNV